MEKQLELNLAWCKGCGVCAAFCPKQVLRMEKGKVKITSPEACITCGICETLCPDFAIYLVEEESARG